MIIKVLGILKMKALDEIKNATFVELKKELKRRKTGINCQ